MKQVFVYGSLKRGGFLNHLMRLYGAEFVRVAVVRGFSLWSVAGMYPAMLPMQKGRVRGEVWDVPDHAMRELDGIEAQYLRKVVTDTEGKTVQAYVWRPESGYEYLTFHGDYWDAAARRWLPLHR